MADGQGDLPVSLSKSALEALLASGNQSGTAGRVQAFDTATFNQFVLPAGAQASRPLRLGNHLLLVQADGSVIVLENAATKDFLIRVGDVVVSSVELLSLALSEQGWTELEDAAVVDLTPFLAGDQIWPSSSVDTTDFIVNAPLEGLAINPLLPPTEFSFPEFVDDQAAGGAEAQVGIDVLSGDAVRIETDAPVTLSFSSFIDVSAGQPEFGEVITEIGITVSNVPVGTIASGGSISGTTFTFLGSPAEFETLTLTFPRDFSTESRIDAPEGPLEGQIFANSNFGAGPTQSFPLTIFQEEDLQLVGPGTLALTETDAPTLFRPADAVLPEATDIDGSERVDGVQFTLSGLPSNAEVSFDGGSSFVANPFSIDFTGSLSDYELIVVRLPADFSTTNPVSTISGVVAATTNEGGADSRAFVVTVQATPDITVTAPPIVTGVEDGNGADGSGITLDLGLDIAVTDIDGSEDGTQVVLSFSGLPNGTLANVGAIAGQSWVGSVAQANALTLTFPGDFSGTIPVSIVASNPEGTASTSQVIEIAPTGDVDLIISALVVAETDAPVQIAPATVWQAQVSDVDLSEALSLVTLELGSLPPGVVVSGIAGTSFSYDTVLGGSFSFSGSAAEYQALRLAFPADYSTKSTPGGTVGTLTGTLSATSNEGANGPVGVELTITPEGDAEIDGSGPDTVPDETDAPTVVTPADLLAPLVTDPDGSEALETLVLVVDGLPGDGSFVLTDVTGLPAGGVASLAPNPTDDSATLTITLQASVLGFGTLQTAYAGLSFELPADFSTANRSDLDPAAGTSRPLDLTLRIDTDEDQNPGVDGPSDGTAVLSRQVDIVFEPDIELNAPLLLAAEEDGGVIGAPAPGVLVDLQLDISITDIDGSETADPTDPRFAAVVDIAFGGLPATADVNGGTLDPSGTSWRGTVQEANDLILDLPGDFSGTVLNVITVTTPEGSETLLQTLVVTPTPDIIIVGDVTTVETDDVVTVLLSDFIDVIITDPNETITQLTFSLPDLPVGTASNAGSFTSTGPDSVRFDYTFIAGSGAPDPTTVTLTFPKDYSTTSPAQTLEGELSVTTDAGGPIVGTIPVTVDFEPDVVFADGTINLAETDDVVTFKPSDAVTPAAIDEDMSETIEQVAVIFDTLPPGTRVSLDDGGTFAPATPALGFVGSLAQYNQLVIELPADFSTQNPATSLTAQVLAVSNESTVAEPFGSATLTVAVAAEGDLEVTNSGSLVLSENDAVGDTDEDNTTQAPLLFKPSDVASATAASAGGGLLIDDDGSESVAEVRVVFGSALPNGALFSTGGAFVNIPASGILPTLTGAEYTALEIRLPDDFSNETPLDPINVQVTFRTDEALLASETDSGPTDGIETVNFSVSVNDEADIDIRVADISVFEDVINTDPSVDDIPLNIDAVVTDIDGSETIIGASVFFEGLPTIGSTVLSDGTVLNGPTDTWMGSFAVLQTLAITSFPEHFSGVVTITPTVVTNEGDQAGTSASFLLNVLPVAEPEVVLSVEAAEPQVTETSPNVFSVKEDTDFLLLIDANTPDRDNSEQLTQITIDTIPPGWLPDGAVPSGLIEAGAADIASAVVSGGRLTIILNPGLTSFSAGIRVTPGTNDDRDIETIVGSDLVATVSSEDTATGLPTDTSTGVGGTDVNIDAVVDPADITVANQSANENVDGRRGRPLGITGVALQDNDGSERFDKLEVTLTVTTASDAFDPSDTSLLELRVADSALRSVLTITQVSSTTDSVTYEVVPLAAASTADVIAAFQSLQVRVAQHFSGIIENDTTFFWSETQTGDAEDDLSDNAATQDVQTTITFQPVAEADLALSVFVRDDDITNNDTIGTSATSISGAATDGQSVTLADILTLRESTLDGSGPGTTAPSVSGASNPDGSPVINDQVQVYLGLAASTPDRDGSEELERLVISNIPTDWVPDSWQITGDIPKSDWETYLTSLDGSTQLAATELAKIDSIAFDLSSGTLTVTFAPDVEDFSGSVALTPTPYEDWDPDQVAPFGVVRPGPAGAGDRFGSSEGTFFGNDIVARVETRDTNTVTDATQFAEVEADIDVAPVNNNAYIVTLSTGNEAEIDNPASLPSGTWEFSAFLETIDQDVSEILASVVLRAVPLGVSVYVPVNPSNPSGPYEPALITKINPDGSADWSLTSSTWENLQFRGIPLHFAGDFDIQIDLVTEEFDGGGTGVTQIDTVIRVEPVADGGSPRGSVTLDEDTSKAVNISANIIDNAALLAGRPNDVSFEFANRFRLVDGDFPKDSFNRPFLLFDGPPQIDTANPPDPADPFNTSGYLNLIDPTAWLDWSVAENLHILTGLDSNEELSFQIEVEFVEDIDRTETTTNIGTVTIVTEGVADKADVTAQQEDPDQTPGSTLTLAEVDAVYRAASGDTDPTDSAPDSTTPNFNRLYGYAGDDSRPFLLNQRLTDLALRDGFDGLDPADVFQAATPLSATMTETTAISGGTPFDGSETLYYLISGIPPGAGFLGVTPVDPTGQTVLVTELQLANLTFVPPSVDEVTYYDLQFNALVFEDDVDQAALSSARASFTDPTSGLLTNVGAFLSAADNLRGGAVTTEQISIVVLPDPVGGGGDCPTEDLLPPVISLVGEGDEDAADGIEVKLVLTPNSQYDDLFDLINLPNPDDPTLTLQGDLGILIELPPGASIGSNPPGAVIYDPVSDGWAIDLAKLLAGNGPSDTVSAGSIIYFPPEHESSPVNPFDPADTFGNADPYDNLPDLEVSMVLNNITCGTSTTGTGTANVIVNPVVDGPSISVALSSLATPGAFPYPVPEDERIALDITISGVDGGERVLPGSDVIVTINGTHIGGPLSSNDQILGLEQSGLYDSDGNIIDDGRLQIIGGNYVYTLTPADLAGLFIVPKNHIHGELTVSVQATAEDIDGSTATGTGNGRIEIDAIADEVIIDVDETILDPETGLPVSEINDNGTPLNPFDDTIIFTVIEDQRVFFDQLAPVSSADQDGSEVVSVVFELLPFVEIGSTGPLTTLIDNGDGTFTVGQADFDKIFVTLETEHARTPDNLDPTIPNEIPITLRFITFELPNGDEKEVDETFLLRVRPDADKPDVIAEIAPTAGTEDQPQPYALTISGTTPDPHETMEFEISGIPAGGLIFVGGTQVPVDAAGTALLPGVASASASGIPTFLPDGQVTFIPPADFADSVSLTVRSITTDDNPAPWNTDGYVDQEPSDPVVLDLDITVAPDLQITQTDDTIVIGEGDAPTQPSFRPADNLALTVTDTDGSEAIDGITYTLASVPAGTTYTLGGATIPVATADLSLSLTEAEFALLEIQFPVNYSTNGSPLAGSLNATTNEGGDETVSFTVEVTGELDLVVTVTPTDQAQTGSSVDVPLGIDASLELPQSTSSETLDEVVVAFSAPLPTGSVASGGTLSPDRSTLTLTRGAMSPTDFAAMVAALTITLPGDFSGALAGTVVGTTNHGVTAPVAFSANVNDQPDITGPVDLGDTDTTSTVIPLADFLANASDPDGLAGIDALVSDTSDVTAVVNGTNVEITTLNGFSGLVTFTYNVLDSGTPTASISTSATLDVERTFQLVQTTTTTIGPDGVTQIPIADDIDGGSGGKDTALGTNSAEAVVFDPAARDYSGIEGFSMLDGGDLVDLSLATIGFNVDLGAGDDAVLDSAGADTLTGGTGADVFGLGRDLTVADVITDYEESVDQIDLSSVLTGSDTLDGRASYAAGELTVLGEVAAQITGSGGTIPSSVEVIFETASGGKDVVVI
ncbi:MAG: hypothetical protein AAGA38_06000 [Pseudomonadota bacterium]